MRDETRASAQPPAEPALTRRIRAADPLRDESPLQPSEAAAIRNALDRARRARRRARVRWAAAALAAAAIVAVTMLRAGLPPAAEHAAGPAARTDPRPARVLTAVSLRPHRLAPAVPLTPSQPPVPGPESPEPTPAPTAGLRQIHLTAANGTRIVWSVSTPEAPSDAGSRENRS